MSVGVHDHYRWCQVSDTSLRATNWIDEFDNEFFFERELEEIRKYFDQLIG